MSFKEWKNWVVSLPWSLRWFVFLVLFRPVIDSLYLLKKISPLISPPYIVGVLTPILCLQALFSFEKKHLSVIDIRFVIWTIFATISIVFLLMQETFTFNFFQFFLKLSVVSFVYFFLRILIRSERDLHGILQAFLYSTIFVAIVFLYEVFVSPINTQESRGLIRIQGFFGDVVNYSIYSLLGILIGFYFFFKKPINLPWIKKYGEIIVIGSVSIGILMNIHHSASWGISIALFGLFFIYNTKRSRYTTFTMLLFIVPVLLLYGKDIFVDKISPLIETDLAVLEGIKVQDRLFHGRVGRWKLMWEMFTTKSMAAQFFGYPLSFEYSYAVIGTGSHNDYLRILMFTGYFGLLTYLSIIGKIYRRIKFLRLPEKFLGYGMMMTLILFSISVTPTMYTPFVYVALSIFAFITLPAKKWYKK